MKTSQGGRSAAGLRAQHDLASGVALFQRAVLSLTSALIPCWYTAIANGHGADDVAAAITTATLNGSPSGRRIAGAP